MKRLLCALLALALLALPACAPVEQGEESGLWYLYDGANGPVWSSRAFVPLDDTAESQCRAVLDALRRPPEGLRAALPAEVRTLSLRVSGDIVYVDFSAEYAALSPAERSVACAAVVRSLLLLDRLFYVSVTAEGQAQSPYYERYCTLGSFVLAP